MPLNLDTPQSRVVNIEQQINLDVFRITSFRVNIERKEIIIFYKKGYMDGTNEILLDYVYEIEIRNNDYDTYIDSIPTLFGDIKTELYNKIKSEEDVTGTVT